MRTANAKATASFAMDSKTKKIQKTKMTLKILMTPKKKMKVAKSKEFYFVFPEHPLRNF